MNYARTEAIRNILIKYSLFKRALNRFETGRIRKEKFIAWTKEVIKTKHKSFLSLPVCEHLFGQYFTELYTQVKDLQDLTDYSKIFCTFHFYRLRNHILRDEILTEKFGHIMIFLLMLNIRELRVMGFRTVTVYKNK
jgi:hypothetical protein